MLSGAQAVNGEGKRIKHFRAFKRGGLHEAVLACLSERPPRQLRVREAKGSSRAARSTMARDTRG